MPESEKESKDKLEFPILYPKCPHCGCEETVAAKYKALQVAAGLMKDDTALFTSMAPAALSDMREPHIALDFLLIFKDIEAVQKALKSLFSEAGHFYAQSYATDFLDSLYMYEVWRGTRCTYR